MRYFFRSPTFKMIASITLILLLVLGYTRIFPNDNFIENGISYFTTYAGKGYAWIADKIDDYAYQFREKEDLRSENEQLRYELSALRDKVVDYHDLKLENAKLRKLYDIKRDDEELKFVEAGVIGRDIDSDFGNFMIDKGTNDGVSVGDAVITENGFVGSICKINAGASYVRTILSADCKVGVCGSESNETGVLSGNMNFAKSGLTRMEFISAQSPIKQGEIVVTEGIGGMYPRNLKIGTVKSTAYDEHDSFYYAVIEPFENIKAVKKVFVINDFANKGKMEILTSQDTENQFGGTENAEK